ncbi:transcriptional regulator, LacI family [Abditibacterium utsteinense]|uniref:Transcriptional regulator, LacI family n=1 Tax=Abditibacterium utsteinense TaxID=1960156 RepID=A0A2S8STK5_9BACT|nr:LacI family DNA-binding transcriptional regulator [Abditibacterium utsteinense]PQV64135.1 transcriptional regulator, LacI family [Abditibacterium utsteinense]
MRPSIQHVAEQTGVSRMTVSNVLRGHDNRASKETRQRVLDAARELGYVPVAQPATQTRQVTTRTLSVVFDDIKVGSPGFGGDTFAGMIEAATQHNYDLLTLLRARPHGELDREEMRFLDRRSDGVIFVSDRVQSRRPLLEILVRHRIPVVVCYGADVPPGVDSVGVDNALAMQQVVDCLVQQGHKRIAFLAGRDQYSSFGRRREGFEAAMRERGRGIELHPSGIISSHQILLHGDEGAAATRQLIASGATAVVCANDLLALSLWDNIQNQGLRVPQDISIVGMDNLIEAGEKGLTTVALPALKIGTAAAEIIARRIEQESESPDEHIVLATTLIERDSVCAPARP